MYVSADPRDELITYSLGSCIGITAHDREAGVGGLIHCLLPLSKTNPEKAKILPAMFVDTGVLNFLNALYALGASSSRLVIKVAGGANLMDEENRFRIGERNVTVLRKMTWKNKLLLKAADVGGTTPRTVSLHVGNGTTRVFTRGTGEVL